MNTFFRHCRDSSHTFLLSVIKRPVFAFLFILLISVSPKLNAQGGVLTGWGMSICQQYSFSVCPGGVISPLNYGNQNYACTQQSADDVSFINQGSAWRVNKSNWSFSSATNYVLSGFDQFSAFQSVNINAGNILSPLAYSTISGQQYVSFSVTNSTVSLLLNQNTFSITLAPMLLSGGSHTFCTNTQTSVVLNATVPVTGGPYTYTWLPGFQTTHSIAVSPNVPSVYTVNVKSVNGCTATALFPVSIFTCATVNIVGSSHSCLNGAGDATATVVGGIGPYTYTWLPTLQTGSVTTGVSPGTHTVIVFDSGANATYSAVATLSAGIPYSIVVNTETDCQGIITATAIVTTSSSPQTFTWTNGVTYFASWTTNTVTGLTAGVWTVSVWNSLSYCVTHKTFVVTHTPLTATVSATSFSACTGTSIVLTGVASGGKPGYTYQWSNAPPGNVVSVSHAVPGIYVYTLQVTDTSTCIKTTTISVRFDDPPSMSVALTSNSLCFQAFNGSPNSVTLTASGSGTTYSLLTPDLLSSTGNSGSFSVTTTPPFGTTLTLATATLIGSNNGCNASVTVIFTVVPNPTVSIVTPTPIICAGESFTYTSWGANSYTWGPGSPGLSTYTGPVTVASPTITTVYSVIGGSVGCNSPTQTTTITVLPLPVVSINPQTAIMCRHNPITLSAQGSATSFTWFPATGLDNQYAPSVAANPSVTQEYTLTGAAGGCTNSAIITVTVMTFAQPTITVDKDTVCLNDTVKMSGMGGDVYQWAGPGQQTFSGEHISFNLVNMTQAGTYTLSITDAKGCTGSATQVIHTHPLLTGNMLGNFEGCVPFCEEFNFKALNFSSNNQSKWRVGSETFNTDQFKLCLSEAGNYTISGELYNSKTTCRNTVSYQVIVHPQPQADFSFTPEQPVETVDDVYFTNTTVGGNTRSWNWYFNHNKGFRSSAEHPTHLYMEAGIYPVALVVTDERGCSDTIVKTVTVKPDFHIYIPNTFTPNSDERNDVFKPVVSGVVTYNLRVYNRWGEKVFETSDPAGAWDGAYGSEPCKQDAYNWKITLSTNQGEPKTYSGHVMLLR